MFEVIYHYFDRNEDGHGYNVSETKQMKRKIGSPDEEVSHDKLAGSICAMMARRDILVDSVDVFEYTKKKIAFKETKGGVVIGNRKYSFDSGSLEFTEVIELSHVASTCPAPTQKVLPAPKTVSQRNVQLQINQDDLDSGNNVGDLLYFQTHRPIREEMFAPKDKALAAMAKARKMPFTIGKTYPIYEEKVAPGGIHAGMLYTVRDDTGQRFVVSDKFFDLVPKLYAGELFDEDPNLNPSESAEMDMPDVSRMRSR